MGYLDSNMNLVLLLNAAVSSTGTSTTGVSVSNYTGSMQILVSARTGGTGAVTVTVEHCDTVGGTYATVPTYALLNVETGAAATFSNISTTAYAETLVLQKEYCKRYVRVTLAGTSLTHNVAIVLAATEKDSAF